MSAPGHSRSSSLPDGLQAIGSSPVDRQPYRPFAAFMYRKIRDYVLYRDSSNKHVRAQAMLARAWIFDEGQEAELWRGTILSFDEVCSILDLPDPDVLRERIGKLRKEDLLQRIRVHEQEGGDVHGDQ